MGVAANIPPKKLPKLCEHVNIGLEKTMFMMPAMVVVDDAAIRWTSQLAMDEQASFEGTWSADALDLKVHHRRPGPRAPQAPSVRCEFLDPSAALARSKVKAAKAPR
ncbi:MAG: hypothetical protein R3B06_03025 [Kofleriaceae bacterium]